MEFTTLLKNSFKENANNQNALKMQAYMRNKFIFYGIQSNPRRDLLKSTITLYKGDLSKNISDISWNLFTAPQRELHHCGMELFQKHKKNKYHVEDIQLIEKFISTNSWWDTVDYISKWILGNYLQQYPNEIPTVISKFSTSKNMWLNRSAILFQLGYKENTNQKLLFSICLKHNTSKEFFIQKAIGWSLREYGKYQPNAVLEFVKNNTFAPLSKKEAIRNIIK
ncbi:MAG: DNA alkylation repair protein [Oceanihabitans sp.]